MELIKILEQKLINQWKLHDFDLSLFADISANFLSETDFPHPLELVKGSLTHMPYNHQNHQRGVFADIPFTLVKNDFFSIDVFFWFHAHTSIHDHPFTGAFKVLKGSSRHLIYDFKNKHDIESWLSKGELHLLKNENITQGHVQKVKPGPNYIHQVLHQENPAVTLIIKSTKKTHFRDYIYPSFAWVDRLPEQGFYKQLSLISSYFKFHYNTDPKSCHEMLEKAFSDIPAHDLFLMTYNYPPLYFDKEFQTALENLIISDLKRFAWYNDLKSARLAHTKYIQELLSE